MFLVLLWAISYFIYILQAVPDDTQATPADTSPQKDAEDDGGKQKSLKRKAKKPKDDADSEAISTIAKSISSVVEHVAKKPKDDRPTEQMDETDLWARLLATKIRKLDQLRQEEFKFRVDGLILEELKASSAMPNI